MDLVIGMIVRTDGGQVTVRDVDGSVWRCVLRGRLRSELAGTTSPVAVGDRVQIRPVAPREGVVERVLPRRSQLARRAAGDPPREQVLAANLHRVVIVVPAPPRATVIDRYLAIAQAGGCEPVVCVNKVDLVARDAADTAVAPYRRALVPVVLTSALVGEGLDELRTAIAGRFVAFVGPSGAGKTSLLNALDPALRLCTGSLAASGRGSHTTSWAAVYQIGDALVVDTPGLREIGFLADEGRQASSDFFPEISALAAGCRFRDCSHTHEPKCAVKAAVETGEIDPQLYRRYVRLARSGRA